ncbi:MAG: DUF58 domain-containing protein [Planctomycetes bacterium]|nr:DUF58 domain-containing protein [Planctomycetota bacterium]
MTSLESLFFTLPAERTRPFLARLESLRVRYQRRIHGWGRGAHVSVYAGTGMEFREFRDYAQGDDVRQIDWKTTARFERPFVRTFQNEDSRFVHFLLDASESMRSVAADRKLDSARDLALALGYLALCTEDPALFSVFPATAGGQHHVACTSRARVFSVRRFLAAAPSGGELDLPEASAYVLRQARGRSGTVVVLSDFLYPEPGWRQALRQLAGHGLQVAAIHIQGPSERDLPRAAEQVIQVRDSETGQTRRIAIDEESRRMYRHAMAAHRHRLQSFCYALRIWYASFAPPDARPGDYLEDFTLRQLPGMGFLRGKV